MNSSAGTPQTTKRQAFTLVELVVVLAMLGLLALLLTPVLAGSRASSKSAQCLNNLRRLTGAWLMYTSDNADLFPNRITSVNVSWGANPDGTNSALLIDPNQALLSRYIQSPDLFKCPADEYQSLQNLGPRILSISGNAIFGNTIVVYNEIPGRNYVPKFTKLTQLNKPGPANTLTLLDEHPDSIDDSLFFFNAGLSLGSATWRNLPGSLHNGAGAVSFSDGHAFLKRWQDLRTVIPVTYTSYTATGPHPVPGSVDYVWINDHMPYQ